MNYLMILGIALVVILLCKFLFHVDGSKLVGLIVNAIIGFAILWLINYTGLVSIPINIITALIVGIFGLPGVVVLIILALIGVL
jgi:inhibitor of the pro-sigma K processing machinery